MPQDGSLPLRQGRRFSEPPSLSTRERLVRAAVVVGAGTLACLGPKALLALGDLPICAFKQFTGVPCPLCGGTRAMGHLADFEFLKAIDANVGVVLAAGLLGVLGFAALMEAAKGRMLMHLARRRRLIKAGAAFIALVLAVGWVPRLVG